MRCSLAPPVRAGRSRWRSFCARGGSGSPTPAPTIRRPAARSNASSQTVKKWLDRQPRPVTVGRLQAQLDRFRGYYNGVRPHRALDRRTPAPAYSARPKAVPTRVPLDTAHYRVRHDRIDPTGVITLRHNGRLHHIGLGRRHAGTRVLVLVRDLHIRVLDTIRRTPTRTPPRPDPGQPATDQTMNDVATHPCTVSRDITLVGVAGFEPTAPRSQSECATKLRHTPYGGDCRC